MDERGLKNVTVSIVTRQCRVTAIRTQMAMLLRGNSPLKYTGWNNERNTSRDLDKCSHQMINQWKRLQNLKYFHSFLSFYLENISLCSQDANRHKTNFQMTNPNTYWRHSEFKSTVKHLSRMFWGDNNKRIHFQIGVISSFIGDED